MTKSWKFTEPNGDPIYIDPAKIESLDIDADGDFQITYGDSVCTICKEDAERYMRFLEANVEHDFTEEAQMGLQRPVAKLEGQ